MTPTEKYLMARVSALETLITVALPIALASISDEAVTELQKAATEKLQQQAAKASPEVFAITEEAVALIDSLYGGAAIAARSMRANR